VAWTDGEEAPTEEHIFMLSSLGGPGADEVQNKPNTAKVRGRCQSEQARTHTDKAEVVYSSVLSSSCLLRRGHVVVVYSMQQRTQPTSTEYRSKSSGSAYQV
jgi:hypothetical protein